jgi:hypothetical protein
VRRHRIALELPISAADMAYLELPADLTAHEAARLAATIRTMGLPGHNPYPLVRRTTAPAITLPASAG